MKDGRDLVCQVRDAAAVAMCKLAGKRPGRLRLPAVPQGQAPERSADVAVVRDRDRVQVEGGPRRGVRKSSRLAEVVRGRGRRSEAPTLDSEAAKLVKQLGNEKRKRGHLDIHAEPADEVDRAGITAFRDITSLQPARQLIFVVRRKGSGGSHTGSWEPGSFRVIV